MANLVWESVDIRQAARKSGEAFASIGQGRITLNPEACALIKDIYDYEFAEVMQAKAGNKVVKLGFRFTKTKTVTAIHATRRKYKGELVDGINFNCKALIKKYFGETKENCTTRHSVELMDDNIIAIDLFNEL